MFSRYTRFGLILAAFSLLLAACGGASAAPEKTAAVKAAVPVTVDVTLSEGAGGMTIESSLASFEVGVPYTFVVTNKGVLNHEFMITPTMTTASTGSMSMEDMDEMALTVIHEEDLTPGAIQETTVTFAEPSSPGILEFTCYVPGHYEAGMKLPITVQ